MILNIYKEKNWTSFDVVKKLKNVLGVKKIGHAGTLDPLAEGVLLVLTESDTKRQDELMDMEKEYVADIAFGATSETYDLEGDLRYSKSPITEDELKTKLKQELPKFIGEYELEVPQYSAVKVDGKRLYKFAREGKIRENPLPKRKVKVYSIEVLDVYFDENLSLPVAALAVTCAKGFYVRSLANELGNAIDTGGVLINLVRTRVGDYTLADSKPISSFSTGI